MNQLRVQDGMVFGNVDGVGVGVVGGVRKGTGFW